MAKTAFNLNTLLNAQSKSDGSEQILHEAGKWFTIRHIPLSQIRPSPKNEYGMRDIETLAESILTMGLMHNIVVRETDEQGAFEIISEERRYRAFQMLCEEDHEKYSTIPCKVETRIDDSLAEFFLLQTSATAREHTDYERTYQAVRLKQVLLDLRKTGALKEMQGKGLVLKGRLREAIAEMFDVSAAQVGRWEGIHKNLIPAFMLAFKKQRIGVTTAYDLSTLSAQDQETALKTYKEDGQDAFRDILGKRGEQAGVNPVSSEATAEDDKSIQQPLIPTANNVQKQNRQNPPANSKNKKAFGIAAKPLIGTDAQYQSLLNLGIESKLILSYAKNTLDKAKYTARLEAFTMVAEEFGFGRRAYLDDIEGVVAKGNEP